MLRTAVRHATFAREGRSHSPTRDVRGARLRGLPGRVVRRAVAVGKPSRRSCFFLRASVRRDRRREPCSRADRGVVRDCRPASRRWTVVCPSIAALHGRGNSRAGRWCREAAVTRAARFPASDRRGALPAARTALAEGRLLGARRDTRLDVPIVASRCSTPPQCEYSGRWSTVSDTAYDNYGPVLDRLAPLFEDSPASRRAAVLDVGAATGALTSELRPPGAVAAADDLRRRRRGPRASVYPMSRCRVPPPRSCHGPPSVRRALAAARADGFLKRCAAGVAEMRRVVRHGGSCRVHVGPHRHGDARRRHRTQQASGRRFTAESRHLYRTRESDREPSSAATGSPACRPSCSRSESE